jgi:hypothetical protein
VTPRSSHLIHGGDREHSKTKNSADVLVSLLLLPTHLDPLDLSARSPPRCAPRCEMTISRCSTCPLAPAVAIQVSCAQDTQPIPATSDRPNPALTIQRKGEVAKAVEAALKAGYRHIE